MEDQSWNLREHHRARLTIFLPQTSPNSSIFSDCGTMQPWQDGCSIETTLVVSAREGIAEDAEDSAASFFKLGIILHEEGNLLAAERAFRMAITGEPTDP